MPVCSICKENVSGEPCQSNDEAIAEGCINPTREKRGVGLDPEISRKLEREQREIHGKSSGIGSWTT